MTEQEQIKLFNRIRKKFKRRTKKWCSGYLHGILDEAKRKTPQREYRSGPHLSITNDYSNGYLYGFIDARGTDVQYDGWYKRIAGKIGRKIEYIWWRK